jgi:hypothetical protein
MVFAELDRRARWARSHRMKLAVQMLTTFGYGALGVAVADPVLTGKTFGIGNLVALAFGLACAFSALYLAPEGERDDVL